MQDRIGGASAGRHRGNCILKSLPRQDLLGRRSCLQQIHHQLPAVISHLIFVRIHRGHAVVTHGREADHLHDRRHCVGRVLSAASACAGASGVFQFLQLGIAHFAGGICPNRFVDILNSDVFAAEISGRYSTAVKHEPGQIEPRQRHGGCWNRLIAAHNANHSVKQLPTAHQLNGVGNHFAAHQRCAHAFGSHSLAIADGNRVELHRGAARGANALFHLRRDPPQVEVARHGFNPGVGDSNQRLGEVFARESDCFKH